MNSELEKLSYSLGVNIGNSLKGQGFEELDSTVFAEAINDVFTGSDLKMSDQEAGTYINQYFSKIQAKKHEGSITAGKEFLAANSKKDGVTTLASGLQYEVLAEGSGEKPTISSTVTTHYHGTTIDGTVFDSSVQRGTPASFPVNGVIAGWTEALQLMHVGSKWRLFVPSDLAYGEKGAGGAIGPHATLIFEVELLDVK
jgi:FKBP-type peptidyl-prolyl cis-trans isomerase FklB